MLSIFSRTKILGLHITEDAVRYAYVLKKRKGNVLLSYGTQRYDAHESHNALLAILTALRKELSPTKIVVTLPSESVRKALVNIEETDPAFFDDTLTLRLTEKGYLNRDENVLDYELIQTVNTIKTYSALVTRSHDVNFFKTVFSHAGFRSASFIHASDALLASCKRDELSSPYLLTTLEEGSSEIVALYSLEEPETFSLENASEETIITLQELVIDLYKKYGEKPEGVYCAGKLAGDIHFLNRISQELRLPVLPATPLSSFLFSQSEVPPMTKQESLAYAVALGCAIR